ncbi:hypothetical protein [Polaribacter butkevichii]|uniref:DUF4168 domain-containing protein n=1 Tax=Polaribacter butkevichii TaxID=218490 RepID=A0A2P6CCK3_9FLAO|nr:hypothetical protein [Polaribacter butkevichii]PQJ72629.1 hypothetical protein BTO14_04885 [Polaribacter butkevichii]
MKKVVLLVFIVLISLSTYSQKRFETAAKTTVEKMQKVISISEAEAEAIYKVELNSNKKRAEVRKENAGNKTEIQALMKEINQDKFQEIRKIIGKKKFQEWSSFLKEERSKK